MGDNLNSDCSSSEYQETDNQMANIAKKIREAKKELKQLKTNEKDLLQKIQATRKEREKLDKMFKSHFKHICDICQYNTCKKSNLIRHRATCEKRIQNRRLADQH